MDYNDQEKSEKRLTNILLIDTPTLISVLVMVVFMLKLFNNVLESNSVGNESLVAGKRKRSVRRRRFRRPNPVAISHRQSISK